MHQDDGRDSVPPSKVWDMTDVVPRLLGSSIRGRGSWPYASDALPSPPAAALYAPYAAGPRLLVILENGNTRFVDTTTGALTTVSITGDTVQNPVFHRDRAIVPRASGNIAAVFVAQNGTLSNAPVTALQGRYAAVFKDRVILASSLAEPTMIAASKPGDPTVAWDALSKIPTSLPLTGIAAQRNQILAFHEASVERLRGTAFPDSAASDPTGDMILEPLFDRAGCYDARSIVNWQDNVIFADQRGVHITDGAIVRNMIAQGGIQSYWRSLFTSSVISIASGIVRDLLHVTVRFSAGAAVTLCCDIQSRNWWRYSNIDAATYASISGDEERLFAGDAGAFRMTDMGVMYNPNPSVPQVDGDGTPVLPSIETGWMRLGRGEEAQKRIRFLNVSYETGVAALDAAAAVEISRLHGPSENDHYHLMQSLAHSDEYRRTRVRAGFSSYGLGLKVAAVTSVNDFRVHDIAVDAYAEEEQRVGSL